MEGMESVYLKGKGGRQKPVSWCSRKITFKDSFSEYSNQLHNLFPSTRTTTKDIINAILPEDELSNERLKYLTELADPNNFRRKYGIGNISEEISLPSTSRENMPSTSKEMKQSTSGKGIPSTSKQQDKGVSKHWFEAKIVKSNQQETITVTAREKFQGPMKNHNTKVRRNQKTLNLQKSDSKKQNNVVHVQQKHEQKQGEKTASNPDNRSTAKLKTYERKKNVNKGINRVKNNEVHNQQYATLSAPSPDKRSIPEIKTYQMQGSVQREINKEVKEHGTSSKEIVSQLLINLLAERIVPDPLTPKESNRSTLPEGILSTSKQQDKAASRNWVEAVIGSSSEEETGNIPVREVGQGSIKKKNNKAKRKQITNKSDSIGQNNHVHVQHNAAAETTVPDPDERSSTEIKTNFNKVKNNEIQNQYDTTLSAPSPEIKIYQIEGSVQRVINKEVDEILSQLSTDVSTKERFSDSTHCSNTVVSTYQNKTHLQNFGSGAINGANQQQVPQNSTSSEAIEIVSQLLESMLINLNSDSGLLIGNPQTPTDGFDLQSKTNVEIAVKVGCLSTEKTLTNTGNTSLEIATPSVDHKESMATTPENPDTFKVPPRRSPRRRIKKKQVEDCKNKFQVLESKELQNASNCDDISEPTESVEGNSEPRYFADIISEITKRGGRNRRRNTVVRGQILVDTTKRLGKKDLIPRKNFVVSFRIHKSFHQNMGQKGVRPGKCLQEIDVLNYQTLADLRKKIMCEADFQDTAGDVSNWPYTPATKIAKNVYKSGMFYINNTFYVDTREGSEDYSVVIRKWAEEHFIQVGETKPMEEMKVEDLEVRMGYPYVYIHQGSCEHLIIISNARLLTEKNSLHSSDYPNLTKTTRSPVYYCVTCTVEPARWIVIGSQQMIQDTNFMCESCFHSFHYVGTQKVGNFKAYRWKQRAILFH